MVPETKSEKISRKYKERIKNGWISPLKGKAFSDERKQKLKKNHADFSGKNNPNYGKKASLETRRKISESLRGEKSPSWKGGISEKNDYRKKAFAEYEHKCDMCDHDIILELQVHHKDRNHENNNVENLQILCKNCHTIEHYRGGYYH